MEFFVKEHSIVKKIWGSSDTILLIFAGAAAEFALNKAVDWLYFTGKLPSDPLGRLFSTVHYARAIVFSDKQAAETSIERITRIHTAVETSRKSKIPDWAYRDVLFMLIYYSIRSYEVIEKPLTNAEKEEVFEVFHQVGTKMHIPDLPRNYDHFKIIHPVHLNKDMTRSRYTKDLFSQYRKHLGTPRYFMLLEAQKLLVPQRVRELLRYNRHSVLQPLIPLYKLLKKLKLEWWLKSIILPSGYVKNIRDLDIASS